jgi:hypothetical protein
MVGSIPGSDPAANVQIDRVSGNAVRITSTSAGVETDALLLKTAVQILIYP